MISGRVLLNFEGYLHCQPKLQLSISNFTDENSEFPPVDPESGQEGGSTRVSAGD